MPNMHNMRQMRQFRCAISSPPTPLHFIERGFKTKPCTFGKTGSRQASAIARAILCQFGGWLGCDCGNCADGAAAAIIAKYKRFNHKERSEHREKRLDYYRTNGLKNQVRVGLWGCIKWWRVSFPYTPHPQPLPEVSGRGEIQIMEQKTTLFSAKIISTV